MKPLPRVARRIRFQAQDVAKCPRGSLQSQAFHIVFLAKGTRINGEPERTDAPLRSGFNASPFRVNVQEISKASFAAQAAEPDSPPKAEEAKLPGQITKRRDAFVPTKAGRFPTELCGEAGRGLN